MARQEAKAHRYLGNRHLSVVIERHSAGDISGLFTPQRSTGQLGNGSEIRYKVCVVVTKWKGCMIIRNDDACKHCLKEGSSHSQAKSFSRRSSFRTDFKGWEWRGIGCCKRLGKNKRGNSLTQLSRVSQTRSGYLVGSLRPSLFFAKTRLHHSHRGQDSRQ